MRTPPSGRWPVALFLLVVVLARGTRTGRAGAVSGAAAGPGPSAPDPPVLQLSADPLARAAASPVDR